MTYQTERANLLRGLSLAPQKVSWPAWFPRLAISPDGRDLPGDVLVVVFLRGAADVLNMIVPHGEQAYYDHRPTLAVPRPDDRSAPASARVIDLDGFFGLHPALGSLTDSWRAGHLGVIHACGAPDDSRSHFRAMELMERGVEDERGPASGWIGRHLATLDTANPSPLRALGIGRSVPLSLRGSVPTSALRSIADFHLGGDLRSASMMQSLLSEIYAGPSEVDELGRETLQIVRTLEQLDPAAYVADGGSHYPTSDFGVALRQVAMLIKAQVGLEVAAIDLGGWDTHFAQGAAEGLMANLLQDLGDGLAAFHRDMQRSWDRVSVVVMSEFGRRVTENASLGTDHGHGSAMLVMGGGVRGGMVHGSWPGLRVEYLFGPGDLAVTTDYRDVLTELIQVRLRNPNAKQIFPGFKPSVQGLFKDL